jgi:hypothetical protein
MNLNKTNNQINTQAFVDLLNDLKGLSDAFEKANVSMDKVDNVNELIVDKYPFSKSFDEMCFEVSNWIEAINEKVR